MRIHGSEPNGVGAAARDVAQHASAIARLEIDLALVELKEKVEALAEGAVLGLGAAILALFGFAFAAAAVAAALATVLATWLALLVVAVAFAGLAGVAGALALGRLRRATPPVPSEAIEEAKLTTEAVRADGSHGHT